MALSVNWNTKVIFVPKADLTLVGPGEVYDLDLDEFRLELKSIEAGEGIPFLDTHRHNTEVTVAGTTLARVVEIINGYTVTFEDGQYAVNLVGANSNVADVTNVNQVSVRPQNSAGLIVSTASGNAAAIAAAVWDALLASHTASGSAGEALGFLDVAVSTRAVPGAAMNLTTAAQTVETNFIIDQQVYNVNGALTSARKRIYTDSTLTTLVRTVTITAVYSGTTLTSYTEIEA